MNAGYTFEKAARRAQANADRTGVRWVLWTWVRCYQISRDWPGRNFKAIEFEPRLRNGEEGQK